MAADTIRLEVALQGWFNVQTDPLDIGDGIKLIISGNALNAEGARMQAAHCWNTRPNRKAGSNAGRK